jgi:hypothetical protein
MVNGSTLFVSAWPKNLWKLLPVDDISVFASSDYARSTNGMLFVGALISAGNAGAQAATLTTLYEFKGPPDGANPSSGLVAAASSDRHRPQLQVFLGRRTYSTPSLAVAMDAALPLTELGQA